MDLGEVVNTNLTLVAGRNFQFPECVYIREACKSITLPAPR